jgi:hypothetical protein
MHFQLDDVCILKITAITKIMAGRMLLNLGSSAEKNLHMITQQCQEISKPTINCSGFARVTTSYPCHTELTQLEEK